MNRLAQEKSAYLKSSADQKISWYPWSNEPFKRAREEDKPLFLSSGGVWCHWCHVMAKECFYDDDIASILNNNFISIKVDRDERPDIDRRYQLAVSAMGGGSGWPLSVFLTPDKKPFYGGTYFPPEDKLGRPGFKKILEAVHKLYKSRRGEISQYTEKLMSAIKPQPISQEQIDEAHINEAVKDMLKEYDPQNGGFGSRPKFPMPGAIDFILNRYFITKDRSVGVAAKKTLESMARGGIYDHIGGGFHRYSIDESWIIPHFEKMADDNAWLLRNYLDAYIVFGDPIFKNVSRGIIKFIRAVLSDPEGGFYSSQDADVSPDDEGGYFTWTDDDFRRVLSSEEFETVSMHLLHERGVMHHDESKKVLFVAMNEKDVAENMDRDINEVKTIIESGKEKLLKERNRKQAPFIDRTFYLSINGMLISSFFKAYRILKERDLRDFALKSLDRMVELYFIKDQLFHSHEVHAFLDDYINLTDSLVSAYEVTGDKKYLETAVRIMDICVNKLWDSNEGGFVDSEDRLLEMKIKNIEDIPHPSPNSLGIMIMLRLHYITKTESYKHIAEEGLKSFSEKARDIGIHAGYYFCALDAYFNSLKLTVNSTADSELSGIVNALTVPYTQLVYGENLGDIVPCMGNTCFEPLRDLEEAGRFLEKQGFRMTVHN